MPASPRLCSLTRVSLAFDLRPATMLLVFGVRLRSHPTNDADGFEYMADASHGVSRCSVCRLAGLLKDSSSASSPTLGHTDNRGWSIFSLCCMADMSLHRLTYSILSIILKDPELSLSYFYLWHLVRALSSLVRIDAVLSMW
jgi:hypothetical protein